MLRGHRKILNKRINIMASYLVIGTYLVFSILPLFFMITTAFKIPVDSFAIPPKFLSVTWTFENFVEVFQKQQIYPVFLNSVIIALLTVIFSVALGCLGGYGLARFDFKGKNQLSFFIMIMRMLPAVALLLPVYVMYNLLSLYNTRIGLVLLYTAFNLPFITWFLWSFVQTVPHELEEAAFVEGLNRLGTFIRVTLPLMRGGIIAAAILSFATSWNEFIFALVLTDLPCRTLPVLTASFIGQRAVYWGRMCALGTIVLVPILLLTAIAQKHITSGLTLGAIKN